MLTQRIEAIRQNYVNTKPQISCERAKIWTDSHRETEGQPVAIRRARAFYDCCDRLGVHIFAGELVVGAIGEFRKCGILTPEFSWMWVDREMDTFDTRPQDPYRMTDDQRAFVRREIFPYWKGKSLEEAFLARLPEDTYRIGVDTGVLDNDSKWRQAVGEITPDYQDVLFKKGFGGILREAEDHLAALDPTNPEDLSKREFYTSVCWTSRGIIRYANRYAQAAEAMAEQEKDPVRAQELRRIARNCRRVPEHPPESFYEAIQFLWFVQVGGILSENPLSLNPGRFDQYMAPYYEADLAQGTLDEAFAQELVDALWLKYSEWVWTISANTADYFAGYNQFQNLTVGGKRRDGKDGTNPVTYLALKATEEVKTHQPGLSVRVQADCPKEFLDAEPAFSLSFLGDEHRKALSYLGSVSGRNEDKMARCGLTPAREDGIPYFAEAHTALFCRKLFAQPYDPAAFLDKSIIDRQYPERDFHTLYIAEIVKALAK